MSKEHPFCRLAHDDAEWGQIAEGVPSGDGLERLGQRQAMRAVETSDPRGGADQKPNATQGDDDDESPAQATDAVSDVGDASPPQEIDEERKSDDRGQRAAERWTAGEVTLHNQQS